jgi:DHA1 family multidrug resistance protein-like MFS transporter
MAYLGDIAPGGDVGKLGGVYNVFGDLGSTLGPIVALPLASAIGVGGEYAVCVALVVVTMLVVVYTLDGDPAPLKEPDVLADAD